MTSYFWLLFLGGSFAIFGFAGLSYSLFSDNYSIAPFVFFALAAALLQLLEVKLKISGAEKSGTYLLSTLYILMAIICFLQPMSSSNSFSLGLGFTMVCIGGVKIMNCFTILLAVSTQCSFISGVNSVVLGVIAIFLWSGSALWVFGVIVSLEFLSSGVTYLLQGARFRGA